MQRGERRERRFEKRQPSTSQRVREKDRNPRRSAMINWVRTTNKYASRLVLNSKFKSRSTLVFGLLFVLLAAYGIQLATVGVHGGQGRWARSATLSAPSPGIVPPSNLSAAALSSSSISLSWQDNSTGENGFQIERCMEAACTNFAALTKVPRNTI